MQIPVFNNNYYIYTNGISIISIYISMPLIFFNPQRTRFENISALSPDIKSRTSIYTHLENNVLKHNQYAEFIYRQQSSHLYKN